MTSAKIRKELRSCASKEKARVLQGFFKTAPGEYGHGDVFLGVTVPQARSIAKKYNDTAYAEIKALLSSPIHEERLVALLLLISRYENGSEKEKEKIFKLYLRNTAYINNWDLVDLSAHRIVGAHLQGKSKAPLRVLSHSESLWERRIAIVSTYYFIRCNKFSETLKVAHELLHDKEDLIHKAVGWMLREVGKRDLDKEEAFLKKHYQTMPRTMLRYAIERFPQSKRKAYLSGKM